MNKKEEQRLYREKNKDKIKAYMKEYRKKNAKKLFDYRKQFYQQHKEEQKKYEKEYYWENKKEISEKYKEYYQKNKEHIRAQNKKWLQTDKGKQCNRFLSRKYEKRKQKIIEAFTAKEIAPLLKEGCKKCKILTDLTVDHIYPIYLAEKDFDLTGIKHTYNIGDIQILCRTCNCKKGIKYDI